MQLSLLLVLAPLVAALPHQQPMACVPSSKLSRDTCYDTCEDFLSVGGTSEEVSINVVLCSSPCIPVHILGACSYRS